MNSTDGNLISLPNLSGVGFEKIWSESVFVISLIFGAIPVVPCFITLIIILLNKNLRKEHNIIPFNIILSDLSVAIISLYLFATANLHVDINFNRLMMALNIPFDFTSLLLILLAALHQFITIRVDPFGAHHIITPPRIICACVVTWLIPAISMAPILWARSHTFFFSVILLWIGIGVMALTGLFYVLIYRSISSNPPGLSFSEERKRENKTVFHTILLVYLTTLIPRIINALSFFILIHHPSAIVMLLGNIALYVSRVLNTLVYWWRQKEFRALITQCRKTKVDIEY
ncbi:uncharacterized protein LOC121406181 [Lytechinus variegatus]|uniref:uncharacterized protein LOC121406181 n=1 Tax=Lytechinus variegatus TaxID=7654 RepID=UPI001BB201B8|nr:uncharacterized protein LOC121406181 [Lytechinus variegatus]